MTRKARVVGSIVTFVRSFVSLQSIIRISYGHQLITPNNSQHIGTIGPASVDLANSFIERWNSRIPMDDKGSWVLDALSLKTGPEIKIVDENPKPVDLWQYPDGAGEKDGTSAVQILRTYPCGFTMLSEFSKKRWEFARLGELSYLRGFEKAALRAREYIYIEDQYGLFENGIFRALSLALEAGLKHLVVEIGLSTNFLSLGASIHCSQTTLVDGSSFQCP